MALVGTAYVRVKIITDQIEKNIEQSVERAVKRAAPNIEKVSQDLGKSVSEGITHGANTKRIETKVKDAIEDGISNADKSFSVDPELTPGPGWFTRMRVLLRPATKRVFLKLDSKSANVFTALVNRASGMRSLTDSAENLFRTFAKLDKLAPLLGGIAAGLGGIIGLGGSAVGWIGMVASQIGVLSAVALPMPGILAGFIAGFTVLNVALKGVGTQLDRSKKQFEALGRVIGDKFWNEALDPIRDFVDTSMPMFLRAFSKMSTELGTFVGVMATSLSADANQSRLEKLFNNTTDSITAAAKGIDNWINGLLQLSEAGSRYLPRLATWFSDLGVRFQDWVNINVNNGNMFQWVEDGLDALTTLKDIVVDTAGVLTGLGRAAEEAGGGGIYTLASGLEWLHERIDSLSGQTALVSFFKASKAATDQIGGGFASLSGSISRSMDTIEHVMVTGGGAIGTLLETIGALLENPSFQAGLTTLVDGFSDFVNALSGASGPLGSIFGSITTVAGEFLSNFGPTLAAGIEMLEPVFEGLKTAITPLIETLGGSLKGAFETLTPVLQNIIPPIADFLGSMGGAPLIFLGMLGGVSKLATAATKLDKFGDIGKKIADLAKKFNPLLLNALKGVFGLISKNPIIAAISLIVGGLIWFFTQTETGQAIVAKAWEGIQNVIAVVVDWWTNTAAPAFSAAWDVIKNAAQAVADWFSTHVSPIFESLGALGEAIWNRLQPAFAAIAGSFELMGQAFQWVWDNVLSPVFQWIGDRFAAAWEQAKAAWDVVGPPLMDALSVAWENFKVILGAVWDWIVLAVETGLANIKGIIDVVTAAINGDWAAVWDGIKALWDNFWSYMNETLSIALTALQTMWGNIWGLIGETVTNVWNSITAFLSGVWNSLISTATGFGNSIRDFFTGIWNSISTTATNVWNSIVTYITGIPGRVMSGLQALGNLGAKAAEWFGQFLSSAKQKAGELVTYVGGLPGKIVSGLGNVGSLLTSAGRNLVQGLINGIKAMAGRAVSAAKNLVGDAIQGAKNLLGIASPSKVFETIGKQTIDGFIKGLVNTTKRKKASKAAKKLASDTLKAVASLQTDMTKIMRRDFGDAVLKGTEKQANDMLYKVIDRLNKSKVPLAKSLAGVVASQRSTLTTLAAQRNQLAKDITSANKFLEEQLKDRDAYISRVYNKTFDTSGILGDKIKSSDDMITSLRKQVEATKIFRVNMEKLRKAGLSKGLLDQLAQAGVDGGGRTARQILAGGKTAIKSLNVLEGQLARESRSLSTSLGDTMFKAGIDATKGLIRGLDAQHNEVIRASGALANLIAKTIQDVLKIKSPSRVMMSIGEMAGEGLPIGLRSQIRDTERASEALARAVVPTVTPMRIEGDGRQMSTDTLTREDTIRIGSLTIKADLSDISDIKKLMEFIRMLPLLIKQGEVTL